MACKIHKHVMNSLGESQIGIGSVFGERCMRKSVDMIIHQHSIKTSSVMRGFKGAVNKQPLIERVCF